MAAPAAGHRPSSRQVAVKRYRTQGKLVRFRHVDVDVQELGEHNDLAHM